MRVFISAGEPSGDLHGSNLARALLARRPDTKLVGFGGDKMRDAGVELMFPLTQLSIMWFSRSIANLPKFFRLADQAEHFFRREQPDAVVLIDYPGFHWHLAKRAKARGIPVYYFVPPQIWAWGGWRVRKMRKNFDAVLSALPFEHEWFKARGVNSHYIGHPYFDELAQQRPNTDFRSAQPIVAILPGSRNQEITANVPLMLAAARRIHAQRPDVKFAMAAFNERQANTARTIRESSPEFASLPLEIHVARTTDIVAAADAAIAVSGSVGLELLYREVPSVIVYSYSRLARIVSRQLMTSQTISLVNLLAKTMIYPEFLTYRDESAGIAEHVLRWLNDAQAKANTVNQLRELKSQVAIPGACERAVEFLMQRHAEPKSFRVAA